MQRNIAKGCASQVSPVSRHSLPARKWDEMPAARRRAAPAPLPYWTAIGIRIVQVGGFLETIRFQAFAPGRVAPGVGVPRQDDRVIAAGGIRPGGIAEDRLEAAVGAVFVGAGEQHRLTAAFNRLSHAILA